MTGATVLNGGLAMDTDKFTVADGSAWTQTLALLVLWMLQELLL